LAISRQVLPIDPQYRGGISPTKKVLSYIVFMGGLAGFGLAGGAVYEVLNLPWF
jgi:hypothetical protein